MPFPRRASMLSEWRRRRQFILIANLAAKTPTTRAKRERGRMTYFIFVAAETMRSLPNYVLIAT
jgi:hypothetical protein